MPHIQTSSGPEGKVRSCEPRAGHDGVGDGRCGANGLRAGGGAKHWCVQMRAIPSLWRLIRRVVASVYTEMNAVSKGESIGVFEKGKGKGLEAERGGSQPYIDLMGRRYAHRHSFISLKSWKLTAALSLLVAHLQHVRPSQPVVPVYRSNQLPPVHSSKRNPTNGVRFPQARPSRLRRRTRT